MARPEKQIAALPWRVRKDRVEVLLVTSRETKRWVIPKGWPMKNKSDSAAAKIEAFEEAGVKGRVRTKPLGKYEYIKRHEDGDFLCQVHVHTLEVGEELDIWPEESERRRKWFDGEKAAEAVDEPDLQVLIQKFAMKRAIDRK
jgi:8-oxo-dGTP pyrophosphatase MutT (NUDIX family)